jgi:hypothetical protein
MKLRPTGARDGREKIARSAGQQKASYTFTEGFPFLGGRPRFNCMSPAQAAVPAPFHTLPDPSSYQLNLTGGSLAEQMPSGPSESNSPSKTAGGGLYAGVNMKKTLFVLFCSVLLGPMVTLSQGKPALKVMIYTGTLPASEKGETTALAIELESQVMKLIMDKYPCVDLMTGSLTKAMLAWEKQKELIGAEIDQKLLEDAVGGFGAKYAITITVSELSTGHLLLGAAIKPGFLPDPQAGGGTFTPRGQAAVDAIPAVAKKFVDSLSGQFRDFTKENCDPTHRWTGSIKYRRDKNQEETTERKAISGDGTVTNKMTRTLHHEFAITIPWTGPVRANIIASESVTTEEEGKVRVNCGGVGIARKGVWKSAGWTTVTRRTQDAVGFPEPKVSVTVSKTRYLISVSVPGIEGKEVISVSTHSDGGCGKPNDKSSSQTDQHWKFSAQLPVIDEPLDQKPRLEELHGSDDDELGGIISWNLELTGKKD